MEATFERLDSVFIDAVQELIIPPHRLAMAVIAEEQDLVLITRSALMLGSKVEVPLPGCWDATVKTGDFEGLVIDTRMCLEDVITMCDILNLNYAVEY